MKRPVSPCINCRTYGEVSIHPRCDKYKEYRADLDAYNEFIKLEKKRQNPCGYNVALFDDGRKVYR